MTAKVKKIIILLAQPQDRAPHFRLIRLLHMSGDTALLLAVISLISDNYNSRNIVNKKSMQGLLKVSLDLKIL